MTSTKKRHINECNQNIEKRYLEERASVVRNYMGKFGWTEKGDELNNGGEITTEIANIVNNLIYSASTYAPGCRGHFTAGNDKYHKNKKSRHNKGQAIDFTISDSGCRKKIIELLNIFKQKYPGFSYIDEYSNPSAHSTGGHFHISYDKSNVENDYNPEFEMKPETNDDGDSIVASFLTDFIKSKG